MIGFGDGTLPFDVGDVTGCAGVAGCTGVAGPPFGFGPETLGPTFPSHDQR